MTAAITALASAAPKRRVSVAALNTATGASYSMGAKSGIWTASVYKLFILETLLLERQRTGTTLSDGEAGTAARAIENSDNVSGYDLFLDIGGNAGLTKGARALGLSHTVPGQSDPTFTTTSAEDCLTLLKNLVAGGPLDKRSRSFTLGLMRDVEADQRWGIGSVADRGTGFANKNGWLSINNTNGPGEDDGGLWVANSLGIVTVGGQQVLMAVLTEHNPDFATGVRLVQAITRQAVKAVVTPATLATRPSGHQHAPKH
ncbi:MAG TPA: serine hydrolase [Jatrophihabitantaceae bacterium]|nr:serine hydrolase [Jatrophihabitantaceae bacterium]